MGYTRHQPYRGRRRALPDLPELASQLSGIVSAAKAIYDESSPGEDPRET